jgi:predicted nucleotidyltransferase
MTAARAFVGEIVAAFDEGAAEAFVIGSAAGGGFDISTSDLDVVVVLEGPLARRGALLERLRGLEPPRRGLELVVYVRGSQPPHFEFNFSGGEGRSSGRSGNLPMTSSRG